MLKTRKVVFVTYSIHPGMLIKCIHIRIDRVCFVFLIIVAQSIAIRQHALDQRTIFL